MEKHKASLTKIVICLFVTEPYCSLGWPGPCYIDWADLRDLPGSVSQVLGLKACVSRPQPFVLNFTLYFRQDLAEFSKLDLNLLQPPDWFLE